MSVKETKPSLKKIGLAAALLALGGVMGCGDDSGGGGGNGGAAEATTATSGASTSISATTGDATTDAASSGNGGEGGAGEGGAGEGGSGEGGFPECSSEGALDNAPCNLETGTFTLEIDNPYYPLPVGFLRTFEGDEEGAAILLEIEVLDEIELIGDVETRVIEEREYRDGEVVEISLNWFAQAADGSVCYFGESVDIYEEDGTITHDGEWRAGEGANEPGIVMPAEPAVGQTLIQEEAPEIAEDHAMIVAMGDTVATPYDDFSDTLSMTECSPLEPGPLEGKDYAAGLGLVVDHFVRLTDVQGL